MRSHTLPVKVKYSLTKNFYDMANKIKINCDCGLVHEVKRDNDAPKNAISMGCNWCPTCEDTAEEYYREWYNYNDDDDDNTNYEPNDPSQLMLFSIADDILENHVPKELEVVKIG